MCTDRQTLLNTWNNAHPWTQDSSGWQILFLIEWTQGVLPSVSLPSILWSLSLAPLGPGQESLAPCVCPSAPLALISTVLGPGEAACCFILLFASCSLLGRSNEHIISLAPCQQQYSRGPCRLQAQSGVKVTTGCLTFYSPAPRVHPVLELPSTNQMTPSLHVTRSSITTSSLSSNPNSGNTYKELPCLYLYFKRDGLTDSICISYSLFHVLSEVLDLDLPSILYSFSNHFILSEVSDLELSIH